MDEIEDLYLSGIASVKAGNRRLAQAFFKRVIRINPRHEGAWLWLSEVLDDPDDRIYCLEAALALDPNNEKARMGLELMRERTADPQRPRRPKEWSPLAELRDMDLPTILAQTPPPTVPVEPVAEEAPRKNITQALVRASIFCGAVLAVLALSIVMTVLWGVPENTPTAPVPTSTIDLSSLREQELEAIRVYFHELDALLAALRLAHDVYRGQDLKPGSFAEGVDSTGRLLDEVRAAQGYLQQLAPPPALAEPHQSYIHGLALEQEALEDFMRYYATSQTGYYQRGMVKFQEARANLDRAKAIWSAYRESVGVPEPTRLSTPSPTPTPTYGRPPTITPTLRPFPTYTPTPFPTQPIG